MNPIPAAGAGALFSLTLTFQGAYHANLPITLLAGACACGCLLYLAKRLEQACE